MKNSINRRDFLKQTGAASLGLSVAGALATANTAQAQDAPAHRNIGADGKISVAVIGTNGRGMSHIASLAGQPNVQIAYICDVDDRAITKGIKSAARRQGAEPKGVKDFRKVLEDKSVDAITIATPDHWHAPMSILAQAAGKHVYCEKPCCQNPREGELIIEAVHKYKGVYQMGNQRRSFPNVQRIVREIHDGVIGKAYFARAWYVNHRASIGRRHDAAVPEWLDYDLWQGPAPRMPFRSNLIHYNWHWFWHWGTGEALNNGTHEVDVCRWALGVDWPSRVSSNGGRYAFDDDWQPPDTQTISWDYPEGKTISWEGRSCNGYPAEGLDRGVMIYGTQGSVLIDSNNYKVFDRGNKLVKSTNEKAEQVDPTNTVSASGEHLDRLHFENFISCLRTGAPPNSPVEEANKSVTMLHLGNISWRVGRELHCDTANGHIQNDEEAMKLWQREYEKGWEPVV